MLTLIEPRSVTDHSGRTLQLPFATGKTLICFFAKDRTPCCGRERTALCDKLGVLVRAGVHVVGVTIDQVRDHTKFASGCSVEYPMIVDTDRELCQLFGVLEQKNYKGKSYQAVSERGFLLRSDGSIEKAFDRFDLEHEALRVLSA